MLPAFVENGIVAVEREEAREGRAVASPRGDVVEVRACEEDAVAVACRSQERVVFGEAHGLLEERMAVLVEDFLIARVEGPEDGGVASGGEHERDAAVVLVDGVCGLELELELGGAGSGLGKVEVECDFVPVGVKAGGDAEGEVAGDGARRDLGGVTPAGQVRGRDGEDLDGLVQAVQVVHGPGPEEDAERELLDVAEGVAPGDGRDPRGALHAESDVAGREGGHVRLLRSAGSRSRMSAGRGRRSRRGLRDRGGGGRSRAGRDS